MIIFNKDLMVTFKSYDLIIEFLETSVRRLSIRARPPLDIH